MKKLVLSAAALLALGASAASADNWHKDRHPYAERHHTMCQEKAHRLHAFERRATADGHLSKHERIIMRDLASDLDRSCGHYRWRG